MATISYNLVILLSVHGLLSLTSCFSNGYEMKNGSISANRQCIKKDSCSCRFENGTEINLHFLDTKERPRFKTKCYMGNCSWNPCTGFIVDNTPGVAVAWNEMSLGLQKDALFQITGGNVAIYYSTDNRVLLHCDDHLSIYFGVNLTCSTSGWCFVYSGPCNIRKKEIEGISTGSIIVIIAFTIIIVYIVGGCLFTSFHQKATGRERCPNLTLWSNLAFLIKDGFTYTCCRVLPWKSRGTYDSI